MAQIRDFKEFIIPIRVKTNFFFIKIEKHLGQSPATTPVQTFFFSKTDQDILFYDTQVKVTGYYTYVVKAYVLVYGSEYSHALANETEIGDVKKVVIDTTIRPSLKIIEVPLFLKTISVSKNPPLFPAVQFINKSNSKNQVKILVELQNGKLQAPLLTIKEEDLEIVNRIKPLKLTGDQREYQFEYSQQGGRFEVFKSNKKIKNYFFDSSFIVENRKGHPHVVFNEKIMPNKKYYYFFRTIDDFGFFSNPTPIYEIELIKDSDSSKVIVNTIEVYDETKDYYEPDLKFGQFMQIKPAFIQGQIDQEGDFDFTTYKNKLSNFGLGEAEDAVWGRKFKFRVTSNNTGKKIDFNLIFDIFKRESEENLN